MNRAVNLTNTKLCQLLFDTKKLRIYFVNITAKAVHKKNKISGEAARWLKKVDRKPFFMDSLHVQNVSVPYLVLLPCAVEDVMSGGLDSLNDPYKA